MLLCALFPLRCGGREANLMRFKIGAQALMVCISVEHRNGMRALDGRIFAFMSKASELQGYAMLKHCAPTSAQGMQPMPSTDPTRWK